MRVYLTALFALLATVPAARVDALTGVNAEGLLSLALYAFSSTAEYTADGNRFSMRPGGEFKMFAQGTAETDDWIQDAEFSLDPWPEHIPGSMVHHGFLTAYKSVSSNVTQRVIDVAMRYPDYKLVFTGHSLGGAETVMCAVDILHQLPELKQRVHIYTYGMPRIGNDAWADGVNGLGLPIYRVVYENDLVPHIPFQWLGYKHFSQEVWIHKNRTVFCGSKD
ncbi:hypothetical protein GGF42_006044, partial [Coemansia sp. RSA 2424]